MDNQNTNGFNGGTHVENNNNPLPNTNPELQSNNNIITSVTPQSNLFQKEEEESGNTAFVNPSENRIEPQPVIKPTLDSILNGNSEVGMQQGNETISGNTTNRPLETTVLNNENNIQVDSTLNVAPNNFENGTLESKPIENVNTIISNNSSPSINTLDTLNQNSNTVSTLESIPKTSSLNTTESLNYVVDRSQIEMQTQNNINTIKDIYNEENSTKEGIIPVEKLENTTVMHEETINSNPQMQQDDFFSVPVPPEENTGKKKKKKEKKNKKESANVSSKALVVILLLILIAAIGFGVYYFLNMAKEKANMISIETRDVTLELGSIISQNVDNYATITGMQKENCKVNIEDVDTTKVSTYKYKVICGTLEKEGTIIVNDTTKPQVVTNDVTLAPNSTLNAADFIERCIDASTCTYSFVTPVDGLTSIIGEYEVEILISDAYNNATNATAKLIIERNAPVKYFTCTSKVQKLEDISASYMNTYKIGIDNKDNFSSAIRIAEFFFNDANSYESIAKSYDNALGIHGIIGEGILNPNFNRISIKANRTLSEISNDINGNNNRTMANNANIIRAWLSGLDYTCN